MVGDVSQRFHKIGYEKALRTALASAKASWERHGDKAIGFKEFIQELEIRLERKNDVL